MIEEITPQIVMATALFVVLVAPALTLPLSALLLWRYRRAVTAAMSARARDAAGAADDTTLAERPGFAGSRSVGGLGGASRTPHVTVERLYREIIRAPWRCALGHAVAGLAFAVVMALSFSALFEVRLVSLLSVFWLVLCAWPIVLVITLVAASTWRATAVAVLVYLAVFVTVGLVAAATPYHEGLVLGEVSLAAQPGVTPLRGIAMWLALNLPPTLLLLACLNRRVRAVGPMVLSFMTVVATGIAVAWWAMFYRNVSGAVVALTVALHARVWWILLAGVAVAIVIGVVLGWLLLVLIRTGYERKRVNEQSLTIDAVWLLFGVFYSVALIAGGLRWIFAGAIAVAVYKVALWLWSRRVSARPPARAALLFLRVFSLGARSQRMFGAVARHWRYVGHVELIAGPDLAMATVEPHQFLDYVSGRLSRLFISTRRSLDLRMASLDTGADADGRFRINSFFCHEDTWQTALARLVRDTDVVLMDLRRFSATNAGCVRELHELVGVVPLPRIVLVVDATTDESFLRQTLEASWHAMPADSPNQMAAPGDVHLLRLRSLGGRELHALLRQLCGAVGSPGEALARAPQPSPEIGR